MKIIPTETKTAALGEITQGASVSEVAKKYEVSRQTIYDWKRTPESLAILRDNIVSNYLNGVNTVGNHLPDIVDIMLGIARDELVKPSDRLKACDSLMRAVSLSVSQLVAVEVAEIRDQLKTLNGVDDSDDN